MQLWGGTLFGFVLGAATTYFLSVLEKQGASQDLQARALRSVVPPGFSVVDGPDQSAPVDKKSPTFEACPTDLAELEDSVRAERRQQIFQPLARAEQELLLAWLRSCDHLALVDNAAGLENSVVEFELYLPSKPDMKAFLDREAAAPLRTARVAIARGAATPPDIMEYAIGLDLKIMAQACSPESFDVVAMPLRQPGEISFSKRPNFDAAESATGESLVRALMAELAPLTQTLWGATFDNASRYFDNKHDAGFKNSDPAEAVEERRIMCSHHAVSLLTDSAESVRVNYGTCAVDFEAAVYENQGAPQWLHNLPISWKYERRGYDAAEWRLYDLQICGNGPFASAQDALAAWRDDDSFHACTVEWFAEDYDTSWSTLQPREGSRRSIKAEPATYSPEGPRFALRAHSVEWLGWSFAMTVRKFTGIAAYDVSFKGESVAWEISLQDMAAMYSGFDEAGYIVYQDAWYGMGRLSNPLTVGVDCPDDAAYLPYLEVKNAICVFEDDASDTVWRHYEFVDRESTRMVHNAQLVVRSITTIGNYDYITDIRFHLDGEIQVHIFAAGYMETTYTDDYLYESSGKYFGERVGVNTLANIHDHLSSWKVDLDVAGEENSFMATHLRAGALENSPPGRPDWASVRNMPSTKWIEREYLESEDDYPRFVERVEAPVVFNVVNENEPNPINAQPRGYKYAPMSHAISNLPSDHPWLSSAAFARSSLAVTAHSDAERRVASNFDRYEPGSPVTSLDRFIADSDSLRKADLVLWPNVGVVHVPVMEDVPLVSNFATGFTLRPNNFFAENGAMDVRPKKTDYAVCAPRRPDFDY